MTFPCAIVDGALHPESAAHDAIKWARQHKKPGEKILLWSTVPMNNLVRNRNAASLLSVPGIVIRTPRRWAEGWPGGPIVFLWGSAKELEEVPLRRATALVVISWLDEEIKPWVESCNPERIGESSS